MDLARKVELIETAVKSVAEHDDAPQKLVEAALMAVKRLVDRHTDAMQRRRSAAARKGSEA